MSKPTVVCLCGSTRFHQEWLEATYTETMAGRIVLSVAFYPYGAEHGETIGCTPEQKVMLDELYRSKIDLCDEILVLNVGGYIGESTRTEIAYAMLHKKKIPKIRWLEPDMAEKTHVEIVGSLAAPDVGADGLPWCSPRCPVFDRCSERSEGHRQLCPPLVRQFIPKAGPEPTH